MSERAQTPRWSSAAAVAPAVDGGAGERVAAEGRTPPPVAVPDGPAEDPTNRPLEVGPVRGPVVLVLIVCVVFGVVGAVAEGFFWLTVLAMALLLGGGALVLSTFLPRT